jgi:aconitate hydratase
VLSGNRNFEGRVNPLVKPSYLASPPLCVVYALAGTVDIDLYKDPIGTGSDGQPVFMKDIWPTEAEIAALYASAVTREAFVNRYSNLDGPPEWQAIQVAESDLYPWDLNSTYVQEPPSSWTWPARPRPSSPSRARRCSASSATA